jgi:hypothetical protein
VPRLCINLCPGICLTTEENHGKTSVRAAESKTQLIVAFHYLYERVKSFAHAYVEFSDTRVSRWYKVGAVPGGKTYVSSLEYPSWFKC